MLQAAELFVTITWDCLWLECRQQAEPLGTQAFREAACRHQVRGPFVVTNTACTTGMQAHSTAVQHACCRAEGDASPPRD